MIPRDPCTIVGLKTALQLKHDVGILAVFPESNPFGIRDGIQNVVPVGHTHNDRHPDGITVAEPIPYLPNLLIMRLIIHNYSLCGDICSSFHWKTG